MKRLWQGSFAARFILLTLVSLLLSQAAVFLISWDEHGQTMRKVAKGEMLSRSASLARVLEATPPALQEHILTASNTGNTRYWVSDAPPGGALEWREQAWAQLVQPLPRIGKYGEALVPGEKKIAPPSNLANVGSPTWGQMPASAWPLNRPAQIAYLDDAGSLGMAVELQDGRWLNSAFAKPMPGYWNAKTATSLGISALLLSGLAILAARAIAQPLRRLARAAEALGRGQQSAPLPETGPEEIRRTAEAFNRMQERLTRFVEDRTRMLAAIGHDLRTPLTTLRLRAEFVADDEIREKLLATVTEIQTMCEATLRFAREDSIAEETRQVDLVALVESLCEDLAELGHDVRFAEAPRLGYPCRPASLRRACRNLVENAVRYGECARVQILRQADSIEIVVEDDGPGIPPGVREQVFAPFFRLENSRNRETGGVGLGLSIARTIIRQHGGDVILSNTAHGLRAVMRLPLPEGSVRKAAVRGADFGRLRAMAQRRIEGALPPQTPPAGDSSPAPH